MFCPHCGSQIPDQSAFCPNCGGKITQAAPQTAASAPSGQAGTVYPDSPGEQLPAPKKGGGKALIGIGAVVAVIALIVAGIFVLPKLGGGGYDGKTNVFAAQAEKMSKRDANYDLVNTLAAADNLLFNAGNLTFDLNVEGDRLANGKLVLGKSLIDSEFSFQLYDDTFAVMQDGVLQFCNYFGGAKIDAGNLYSRLDELENALIDELDEEFDEGEEAELYEEIKKSREALNGILDDVISNGRINYATFGNLFGIALKAIWNIDGVPLQRLLVNSDVTLDQALELAADFAATLPEGAIQLTSTGDSKQPSFDFRADTTKLLEALVDYLGTEKPRTVFSSSAISEAVPEIEEEIEWEKAHDDGNEFIITGTVTTEDNYLTGLRVKYDGETVLNLRISDIGKTAVGEQDLAKIERAMNELDSDDVYTVNDENDLLEMFMFDPRPVR